MIQQTEPTIGKAEQAAVAEYLASGGWLTEFKKTRELETRIESFLGVQHCILVPSGTTALYLSCLALKSNKRTKVVVPDMTMIATANAVVQAGFEVEFCDVNKDNLCLDMFQLNKLGAQKFDEIAGIVYVDFNGRAADLDQIQKMCREYGWFFIEDACQAFGSSYNGTALGTFGDIGCFSLSPHKIITTGQGGFIVTNNDFHAKKIRELKDFGRRKSGVDDHIALGFNYKFTDLQAVVGLAQIDTINWRINRKKEIYDAYYSQLAQFMIQRTKEHTPWFVDIYVDAPTSTRRDGIIADLTNSNIGCRPMYPPLHTQAPYNSWVSAPESERLARTGLWLPSHLNLSADDIDEVCKCILHGKV